MNDAMTQTIQEANAVLIGNYGRLPIVMTRGEGSWVWDQAGTRYLDLFAGFGGGILGHCQADLVEAVQQQAARLWHVGNTFHTQPQIELAERIKAHAFDGRAFFCHSGAEANEAAVKLARLRGMQNSGRRWKTISLHKSFHGRTLAMIAATGNPKVRNGFGPPVAGVSHVEASNFDAIAAAVDDETCCILMEPIQGEGGVNLYPPGTVTRIRKLCDEKGLTLIFDEVWTGCGRTGKWFGHQHVTDDTAGVIEPDIMTLGKAIGGGLPVGVMFAKPELASLMVPGTHGCTLGGNPICAAAAATVLKVIQRDHLIDHAARLGDAAMARLRHEPSIKDKVADIRGRGLFIGIELRAAPQKLIERALSRGLIINLTAGNVIRLAPPINITEADWNHGLDLLIQAIAEADPA